MTEHVVTNAEFLVVWQGFKGLITWRISARPTCWFGAQFSLGYPSPVFQSRLGLSARPNGPENLKKSHVIMSLDMRSDFVFQETRWLPLQKRSDFSGIKEIKHSLDMWKFFLQHQSGTSSPIISCHHWSVRPFITFRQTRRVWRFVLFLRKYVCLAERYTGKDRFRFSSIIF